MSTTIELGDEVRDTITPFQGVAVAITTWLNGCRRVVVQPRELSDKGHLPSGETFDETQLVIVNKRVVETPSTREDRQAATEATSARKRGGPRPEAQQHSTPSRW